jgi:class 3 adenylate cyclase
MLNVYFGAAVPVVHAEQGEIDRVMGDAIMAAFNRRGDQPDHAARAARAALAVRDATEAVAAQHPGWPRFRIGVNTGEAMTGVLGAAGGRSYTVVGDAVNVAARLEAAAPVGGVAVSAETLGRLGEADAEPLGALSVKGREGPVRAFVLRGL